MRNIPVPHINQIDFNRFPLDKLILYPLLCPYGVRRRVKMPFSSPSDLPGTEPAADVAHSQTEYHHNPHDQNLSEIMRGNGLGCADGIVNAMSVTCVVCFAIWLTIKVIEHWGEVTQWIYSAGFTR
jgi:hypothetical protein